MRQTSSRTSTARPSSSGVSGHPGQTSPRHIFNKTFQVGRLLPCPGSTLSFQVETSIQSSGPREQFKV
eukprot:5833328-Amphidinium_carterae.1